jgi:hypothetical protein
MRVKLTMINKRGKDARSLVTTLWSRLCEHTRGCRNFHAIHLSFATEVVLAADPD